MIPQAERIKTLTAKVDRLESEKEDLLKQSGVSLHQDAIDKLKEQNQTEIRSLRAEIERLKEERDELGRKLHDKRGALDKLAKQNEIYKQKFTEMTTDDKVSKTLDQHEAHHTISRHDERVKLETGGLAKLQGLSKAEYNGKIVKILEYVAKKDRWRVQLLDHHELDKPFGAKAENLVAVSLDHAASQQSVSKHTNDIHVNHAKATKGGDEEDTKSKDEQDPLTVGGLAKLRRLSREQFNGQIVEIVKYVKKKDRWRVKLMDTTHKEKFLGVRRENLEAMNMSVDSFQSQSRRGADSKQSSQKHEEEDEDMANKHQAVSASVSWRSRASSLDTADSVKAFDSTMDFVRQQIVVPQAQKIETLQVKVNELMKQLAEKDQRLSQENNKLHAELQTLRASQHNQDQAGTASATVKLKYDKPISGDFCDWRAHLEKGDSIQAWDGKGWYPATVYGVDSSQQDGKDELLICFDNYPSKYDRWFPRTSRNIRPTIGFLREKIMLPQQEKIDILSQDIVNLKGYAVQDREKIDRLERENERLRQQLDADQGGTQQQQQQAYGGEQSGDHELKAGRKPPITMDDRLRKKYQEVDLEHIKEGGYATLKALQGAPDLNGKPVKIVKYIADKNRWQVRLLHPGQDKKYLAVKGDHLNPVLDSNLMPSHQEEPQQREEEQQQSAQQQRQREVETKQSEDTHKEKWTEGARATLKGLAKACYNGKVVEIIKYVQKKDRWRVRFVDAAPDQKPFGVKEEHLDRVIMPALNHNHNFNSHHKQEADAEETKQQPHEQQSAAKKRDENDKEHESRKKPGSKKLNSNFCDWRSHIEKGDTIQAWDGKGWYSATVFGVDDSNETDHDELLICFDNYSSKHDRWYPRNSKNIRPTIGFLREKIMAPQAHRIGALESENDKLKEQMTDATPSNAPSNAAVQEMEVKIVEKEVELNAAKEKNEKLEQENERLYAEMEELRASMSKKQMNEEEDDMKIVQQEQQETDAKLQQQEPTKSGLSTFHCDWRSFIEKGDSIQAWDGKGWFAATVFGEDHQDDKDELLICFDGYSSKFDKWFPRSSRHIRPTIGFLKEKIMGPQALKIKKLKDKNEELKGKINHDEEEMVHLKQQVIEMESKYQEAMDEFLEMQKTRKVVEKPHDDDDKKASPKEEAQQHEEHETSQKAEAEDRDQAETEHEEDDVSIIAEACNWRACLEKGDRIQAWDGHGWHAATVYGVDANPEGHDDLLLCFENFASKFDRWYPRHSKNIRPTIRFLREKIMVPQALKIESLENENETLKSKDDNDREQLDELTEQHREMADKYELAMAAVEDLKKQLSDSHDQISCFAKERDSMGDKEKSLQGALERLKAENQKLKEENKRVRKEMNELRTKMDDEIWKMKQTRTLEEEREAEIKRLQQELDDKNKQFYQKFSAKDNECKQLKKQMESMKVRSDKLEAERKKLDAEIERLRALVETEQTKLKQEEEKVRQIQKDVDALMKQVEEANTHNETLKEQLDAHKKGLKERNATIQKHEDKISELEAGLNEKHTEIVQVKQQHKQLHEELGKVKQSLTDKHQQLENTKKAHKQLEKQKTQRVLEMQAVVDEHKQIVSQKHDELKAMADIQRQKDELLADYERQCEQLKKEKDAFMSEMKAEKEKLEQQLKAAHQMNQSKEERVQQIHQEKEQLHSEYQSEISKLKTKLSAAMAEAAQHKKAAAEQHKKAVAAAAAAKKPAAKTVAAAPPAAAIANNPYLDVNFMAGLQDFSAEQNQSFLSKFAVPKKPATTKASNAEDHAPDVYDKYATSTDNDDDDSESMTEID